MKTAEPVVKIRQGKRANVWNLSYPFIRKVTRDEKPLLTVDKGLSVFSLLGKAKTAREKQKIIKAKNPLHYIFGKKLTRYKDYLTYEENQNG
jgi:hypothetical protein